MTAKKQKEKERRRARKMADEAWEAVDAGNLDLARKLSQRATGTLPDNPRLWADRGRILVLSGDETGADRAFRYAIRLARDYAEPYHHLAALRARQDRLDDAVALEADALRLAPDNPEYAAQLAAYRTEAEQQRQEVLRRLPWAGAPRPADALPDDPPEAAAVAAVWSERLGALDWERLGERLTADGYVVLPGLLPAADCAGLRALFDDDGRFARTVVMDRPDFGEGVYRYFRNPVPAAVAGLRRALYPRLAAVANGWRRRLGEPETYPPGWEAFRDRCRQAGQTQSAAILLRYGPGGFNALHRDLRGRVFFPIQLVAVLSPRADQEPGGFAGGDFLFCDVPEGPKARRRAVAAGLGDAVLFCTRDRLVRIGGVYGLQRVKHGLTPLTAGSRTALGLPFHEHR